MNAQNKRTEMPPSLFGVWASISAARRSARTTSRLCRPLAQAGQSVYSRVCRAHALMGVETSPAACSLPSLGLGQRSRDAGYASPFATASS